MAAGSVRGPVRLASPICPRSGQADASCAPLASPHEEWRGYPRPIPPHRQRIASEAIVGEAAMARTSVRVKPYIILVVEDNPTGLKTVRVTLEKAGYAVREARDGRSVLEMMTQRPDLIIQDLVLPDIDGFQLVRKIRGLPGGADIPIIAYSGLMTRLEEARSIEAGFTDYLFKPIAPERLLEIVEVYLPSRDGHKKVGGGRRLLVVDDDPIHLRLTKIRLERAGFTVQTAEGATEALSLAQQSPPDLILSDVLMPKMDGFQFCLAVRGDARLAPIPVLLFSASYDEETDRQLAREAGANGLVLKSPGFETIVDAVTSTLAAPPRSAAASVPVLGEDYTRRLAQQLDRQMMLATNIRRRLMQREAELAILSSLFDSLKRGAGDEVLEEMLNRVMHAAGVSRGVIYLTGQNGALVPRARSGYPSSIDQHLGDFFGHARWLHLAMEERAPRVALALSMPREILSGAEPPEQSALIAPLLQGNKCLGVLVVTSGNRVLTEEMLPFAGAVGNQIGQALGLLRTLAQPRSDRRRFRETVDRADLNRATPAGAKPLRIIIFDDEAARADLVIRELQHGGFAPEWQRAETESEYLAHLTSTVDVIIARHALPQFDARRALELLQAQHLDIPFIVISPSIAQEAAAALVKLGASDYVLEDRIARLPHSVDRALDQGRLRAQKEWAVASLHESEERYHGLFDGIPVGLYRSRLGGEVLDVNPAIVQILSYPDRETLLNVNAAALYFDPAVRDQWTTLLERDGTVTGFESQLRRFDGSTIWVRASARIVRDLSGQPAYLEGAVIDITEQKQAEEVIQRRAAYLETLNAIISSIVAASDLSELLETAVEGTLNATRCEMGASWTENVQVGRGMPLEARSSIRQAAQSAGLELLGPKVIPDWKAAGFMADGLTLIMAKFGIRAGIAVPIQTGGRNIGGIFVGSPDPRPWLPEEVLLVEAVGKQIGEAVERLQLVQAIKGRTTELEAFHDLSRRLRAAHSVNEMYPMIVEQAMEILRCQYGTLALLTPERDAFTRVYVSGLPAEKAGSTFPVTGTRSGQMAQTGITFVTADFSQEPLTVWMDVSHFDIFGPLVIVPVRSEQEIIGTLSLARVKTHESRPFTDAEVRLLEGIAEIAGTAIRRARLNQNLQQAYVQMVLALAQAIESRDSYTAGHSERMVKLAERIARELGCPEEEVQDIRWGARLHDVGKIGIPDSILNKPSDLTEVEWKMMQQHPVVGEEIIKSVERMREVAGLVRHHQERWDGKGYPDRLKGEATPLGSRILAVVDAYGAITEARSYKPARSHAEAVAEIRRCAGTQFDPRVVEVFTKVVDLIESIESGLGGGGDDS
jgi:PAS domain S-box-containing protein